MSEETNAFVADLHINGKKVGCCKNNGQGGCTDYYGNSKEDNEIIRQAEEYYKTLPKVKSKEFNFEYQPSLENTIDDLFEEWITAKLKAKEEKRIQKLMQKAIIWGVPNSGKYTIIQYAVPLTHVAKVQLKKLQETIDNIKATQCKDGIVILNTNLKELGVNI
jgi:hypothetical protein